MERKLERKWLKNVALHMFAVCWKYILTCTFPTAVVLRAEKGTGPCVTNQFFFNEWRLQTSFKTCMWVGLGFFLSLINQFVFNCQYQSVSAPMLDMGRKKHICVKLCCLPWL